MTGKCNCLFGNIFKFMKMKPPIAVMIIFIGAISCSLLFLGIYVQNHDVLDYEASKVYDELLSKISELSFCSINATSLEMASSEPLLNSGGSEFVNITLPLIPVLNKPENLSYSSSKIISVVPYFMLFEEDEHFHTVIIHIHSNSRNPGNCSTDCVKQPSPCVMMMVKRKAIPDERLALPTCTVGHDFNSSTVYMKPEKTQKSSCMSELQMKFKAIRKNSADVYLNKVEKAKVNFRLHISSYVLFVVLLSVLIYATMKGRAMNRSTGRRDMYLIVNFLTWVLCTSFRCCLDVPIEIGLKNAAALVDNSFLSVSIDSGVFKKGFRNMDFNSKIFRLLAKGLTGNENRAEFYLRIGGGEADHISFDPTNMVTYNSTMFDEIYSFVSYLNWKLVFDLNSLQRHKDGSWDPSNAMKLIDHIIAKGYYVQYELGNEPDLYPTHLNISVEPEQLAKDFSTLRRLLDTMTRNQVMLVGPDTTTLHRYNYFERFLSHIDNEVLDAITFHHYYSSSENITTANFTSVEYLDTFLDYCTSAMEIIHRSLHFPPPPVWIGETSSTYGGGSHSVGESYSAGFVWLDKLGLAAQLNISVVIRQSLKGGFYSLINKMYEPNPDYWSSLLYKQLVGRVVLDVTGYLKHDRQLRVYAHCINKFGGRGYKEATIVLMVLNVNPVESAELRLQDELSHLDIDQYLFSPNNGELSDNDVKLNNDLLKVINGTELPELKPLRIKQPIVVPPLRYGFFVVLDSFAAACNKVN